MRLCYFHQGIRFIKFCSQPSHSQVFLQSSILLKIEVSTFHGCMIMYVITFADGVFRNSSVGLFGGMCCEKQTHLAYVIPCATVYLPVCFPDMFQNFSKYTSQWAGDCCSNQLPFVACWAILGEFPDPRNHLFAHHIAETSLKSMQRHLDPPAANLPIHSSSFCWAYQAYPWLSLDMLTGTFGWGSWTAFLIEICESLRVHLSKVSSK